MTIQRHMPLFAAPLLLALGACHTHFDGYGGPGAQVINVGEIEENDYAWSAQHIGWVSGGDLVIVEGYISDDGFDPRDGYALFAEHPILVEVVLDAHHGGVDLDWCVWDPYVGAYTVCSESDFNPETGPFIVVPPGEEFHLVVSSFLGDSPYTLELFVHDYYPLEAPASDAPALDAEGLADAATAEELEEDEVLAPRGDAAGAYGTDLRWDAPAPDDPIFAGPLFTYPPRDGAAD